MEPVYLSDVTPIDLERYRGKKVKNYVGYCGIELEGGWTKAPKIPGAQIIRDGSVNDNPYFTSKMDSFYGVGELVSTPMKPTEWKDWMVKAYPQEVAPCCGMHIHMSFPRLDRYRRLMCPEFPATVLTEVIRWTREKKLPPSHPIFPRLLGNSTYCQLVYSGDLQVENDHKDYSKTRLGNRYSMVNYAFNRTGTIEHRLLPMMSSVEEAIEAFDLLFWVTNAFLNATARSSERAIALETVLPTEGSFLETRELVYMAGGVA